MDTVPSEGTEDFTNTISAVSTPGATVDTASATVNIVDVSGKLCALTPHTSYTLMPSQLSHMHKIPPHPHTWSLSTLLHHTHTHTHTHTQNLSR